MNTVVFHPWPVRAGTPTGPTSCGSTSTRSRAPTSPTPCAVAHVLRERARRGRARRVAPRPPATGGSTSSPGSEPTREFLDVRHAVIAHRPRTRAPHAGPGHHRLVEGGARRPGLRRLQPGQPRPHDRLGVQPAAAARRAGVDARSAGTSSTSSTRRTSRCAPCRTCSRRHGDPWAGMDDARRRPSDTALALWDSDVDEPGWGRCRSRRTTRRCPASRRGCSPAAPGVRPAKTPRSSRCTRVSTALTGLITSANLVRVSLGSACLSARLEDLQRPSPVTCAPRGRSERTVTIYGQAIRFYGEWLAAQGGPPRWTS